MELAEKAWNVVYALAVAAMVLVAIWAFVTLTSLVASGQTLPAPTAPGSKCVYEVLPDGKISIECEKPAEDPNNAQPAAPSRYREDFLILCRTKILNIETVITIDVTSLELQLFDLDKLIAWAGAQPPVTNPIYAPSYSAWNLPVNWQSLQQFTVDRATWEALPIEKRWAAVKQQPPSQYAKLPISGMCATKILEKLKIKAEEPY